jgi:hypothetical protein
MESRALKDYRSMNVASRPPDSPSPVRERLLYDRTCPGLPTKDHLGSKAHLIGLAFQRAAAPRLCI